MIDARPDHLPIQIADSSFLPLPLGEGGERACLRPSYAPSLTLPKGGEEYPHFPESVAIASLEYD